MQRMTGVDIVVEPEVIEALRHVAGITTFSEVSVVVVVFFVAGNAGHVHAVAERVVAMAVTAGQWRVLAREGKCSITSVVEGCVFPVRWLVTVAALLPAATVVRVILGMAAETVCRRIDEGMFRVAVETACLRMAAD